MIKKSVEMRQLAVREIAQDDDITVLVQRAVDNVRTGDACTTAASVRFDLTRDS